MNALVPRIEHVITGLGTGGAEIMLRRLLLGATRDCVHSVTSLSDMGSVGADLVKHGIAVRSLDMKKEVRDLAAVLRLIRSLRRSRPSLVQTWLYHADVVGGLAGLVAGVPVVWNIRQSNLDPAVNKASTLRLVRICARLSSRVPARIVCGSQAARSAHESAGFCSRKMVVIPNGFDLQAFRPSEEERERVRAELGVAGTVKLVGRIGRFDPQKDHKTFIDAAARILAAAPDVHFVMAGLGMDRANAELSAWMDESGIRERVHLLGSRHDVAAINAALDVAVSSSLGEGFPNVVGEAMACGVPCVVTDVGDSALIVGETGLVVPPRDPESLAGACLRLLAMPEAERRRLGHAARGHIERHYELSRIVHQYEALYSEILTDVRHRRLH